MSDLDGLRLALFSIVIAAVVWASFLRQIRLIAVPRRPAVQLGAMLAAVVLGCLALVNEPGAVGLVLACVGVAAAFRYLLVNLTGRLPGTTPTAQVGEVAPNFSALDESGHPVELVSLRGRAVLLKFFRGHWSRFCVAELQRWEAFRPQLELFGVTMVAISPDDVAQTARLKRRLRLGMIVLSDEGFEVTDLYNVKQERVLSLIRLPVRARAIPTTFLIDSDGVVRWIDQAEDYRVRSDIDRVMAAVKLGLTRQARELRESG